MHTAQIDFNIDFDKLLVAAKAKHRMYVDIVDQYRPLYQIDVEKCELLGYPPEIQEKIDQATRDWTTWVHENIKERRLLLETDMLGIPCAITAILAGKKM